MKSKQESKRDLKGLISAYGGKLKELIIKDEELKLKLLSQVSYELECSDRNACDVELLMVGGFSPLEGFMDKEDYESVTKSHRNSKGLLFGLPIVFDTNNVKINKGETILLTYKKQKLAVLEVSSKWEPDKSAEAEFCYGTNSLDHPAVKMIFNERGRYYLGGKIYGFELPKREFPCKTPEEVRSSLPSNYDVVAFQCRNPIHRAHYELLLMPYFQIMSPLTQLF